MRQFVFLYMWLKTFCPSLILFIGINFKCFCDTIFIIAISNLLICMSKECITGIFHGVASACKLEHFNIIVFITKGNEV